MIRRFAAGCRYETRVARSSPAELSWLFVSPLYSVIFVAIVRHSGRTDLTSYAVLGPAVMAIVGVAIISAGNLIDRDRNDAILELEVAAPGSFPVVLAGRIAAVVLIGLIALPEAWLVAGIGTGQWVRVNHPAAFVLALVVTVLSTVGMAMGMAAVFVTTRSARIFQNSLSYPLFIFGGAVVPTALLPGWMHPICRILYLSWGTDLLRAAAAPAPLTEVGWRLAMTAGLGLVTSALGVLLVERTIRRVRGTGSVSLA